MLSLVTICRRGVLRDKDVYVNMYICLTNVHICQQSFAKVNIDITHGDLDKICIFVNELTNMYMW